MADANDRWQAYRGRHGAHHRGGDRHSTRPLRTSKEAHMDERLAALIRASHTQYQRPVK